MNDKENNYNDIIRNMRSKSNADFRKLHTNPNKKYTDDFDEYDEGGNTISTSHVPVSYTHLISAMNSGTFIRPMKLGADGFVKQEIIQTKKSTVFSIHNYQMRSFDNTAGMSLIITRILTISANSLKFY